MKRYIVIENEEEMELGSDDYRYSLGEVLIINNDYKARCIKIDEAEDRITYYFEKEVSRISIFPSDMKGDVSSVLILSEDDIAMLRRELDYSRCLIWDSKIERNDLCDGECDSCKTPYKIDKWLGDKLKKEIVKDTQFDNGQ